MLPRGKRAFLNYKNKKKQETTKKLIFHLKGFIYKGTEEQSTGHRLDPESQATFYFPKFARGRMREVKPLPRGGQLEGAAEQEGILQTPWAPRVTARSRVKCAPDSLEDPGEGPSQKPALQAGPKPEKLQTAHVQKTARCYGPGHYSDLLKSDKGPKV